MSSGFYEQLTDSEAYEACLARNLATTGGLDDMIDRIGDFDTQRAQATADFMVRHPGKAAAMIKKLGNLDLMLILEYLGKEVEDMENQESAVLRFLVSQSIRDAVKQTPSQRTLKTLRALPRDEALDLLSNVDDRETLVEWYTSACPPDRRNPVEDSVPIDRIREKIKSYLGKYWQLQK
jgi:hypothetical protein